MSDQEEPLLPEAARAEDSDLDEDRESEEDLNASLLGIASEPEGDLDDATATELDHGIAIPELEAEGEDDGPTLAEYAEIDDTAHEDDRDSDDDAGPVGEDASADIEEQEPLGEDDGEGATERLEDLVSGDLPLLGADADGEMEMGVDPSLIQLETGEDETPPRAEFAWQEVPLPPLTAPRTALHALREKTSVATGGKDIRILSDAGATERQATSPSGTVTSFSETADGALVFTTSTGHIARLAPEGGEAVPLRALPETAGDRSVLTLGGPTPSTRPAVLLHVEPEGLLLESTDQGTTWRRVDLGGKVIALSHGTPPVCLVESANRTRFYYSEPTGGFSPSGAPLSTDGDAVTLATSGDVVVVLERGRGVSISASRAATFERVKASSRVTAITAGRLGTRPSGFAATFEPASGRSLLLWIDAASGDAFVVAAVEPSGDDDPEDLCQVDTLAWDPQMETLWVGGAFGVRRFRRPPSA